MRAALTGLLGGLVLAALLAAGSLWAWDSVEGSGHNNATCASWHVRLASDKSLGVNADLSLYSDAERDGALSAMELGGFRWLRQRFPWDQIEPQRGQFEWSKWDEIVDSATRHNLRLVAVLDGAPQWARPEIDRDNPLAPPSEASEFGTFVAAFASRYADQIDHYQIWDEPNIAPHWGNRPVSPDGYGHLLREGAIQVRASDPDALILLAALAPNVEPGGANMSDHLFLSALHEVGAGEWFDVVTVQHYDFGRGLRESADPAQLNWARPTLLRQELCAHGDGDKPVWAASFAVREGPSDSVGTALDMARQEWPWMGPMFWAAWSPEDQHSGYALVDPQGLPGSAFDALRAWSAQPPMAWPGSYAPDHLSGHYQGQWRVTPEAGDIGRSGDRLTIRWYGTRLDLAVRRGAYRGFLFVRIDDQPANALPKDLDGRAYVVLYDPLAETDTVTLARNLPDGVHVAEIIAERGWGQWAILGWQVSRGVPRAPGWLAWVLGLSAAAVLGASLYRVWPYRRRLAATVVAILRRYGPPEWVAVVVTALATIVVFITDGTMQSLLSLGVLAILLLLHPRAGLYLIAFALPFSQLGKPLLGRVFSLVELLTLLTAAAWGASFVLVRTSDGVQGSREWFKALVARLTALDRAVIALVVVGMASLLWAEHQREAVREFRTVILESALFYGLLRHGLRNSQDSRRLAGAWVLGGSAIALVGIGQWAFGHNLITAEGVWRVRGFYGSPNNLALYLGRVLPLAVASAVSSAFFGGEAQATRHRWLYLLAAVVMGIAIALTYSRGAWLLGVPASLLFLAAARGRRTLGLALAVLAVLVASALLFFGPGRLASLCDVGTGTTFLRLQLWRSSWAMVRDHPLLGVGLDNFLYHYRTYYVLPSAWEEFNLSHPHNLFLDFWLRLGLPGLAVLGCLLVAFYRRVWQVLVGADLHLAHGGAWGRGPAPAGRFRTSRVRQWTGTAILVVGLAAGMVNFLAHGLVDNAFFLVDLAFAFMLMSALIQSAGQDG
jgi:O-antigen ligase